jgi:phenylacetate-coenzyme A ligase PaaK-like adenylate-forming protein
VLTFASDMCVVELVDDQNRPVTPGHASAKLLTNVHNLTQPLIRYELTDRFVAEPANPASGHLRATAEGRADTPFRYGSIEISPFAIRSALATAPTVCEYQVRQTPHGLEALIVGEQEPHTEVLTTQLEATLRPVGIQDPEVTVRRVDTIERHAQTGKTRRFIPITG